MINKSKITNSPNKVIITRNYEKSDYILNLMKAEYIKDYKIEFTFSDGLVRIVDFWPFLKKQLNPMSLKYRDLDKFKEFKLYYGFWIGTIPKCASALKIYIKGKFDIILPDRYIRISYLHNYRSKFITVNI